MSEESSARAPGTAPPEGEPVSSPEESQPSVSEAEAFEAKTVAESSVAGAEATEASGAEAPEAEAPEAETSGAETDAGTSPSAAPGPRWRRWLTRPRRASLRVRITAAVIAAAAVAAVVAIVVVPSSSPPSPAYRSLPAPCAMVSLATLATYLPHPTGTPLSFPTDDTFKAGSCKWSSTADGEDRTLESYVVVFRSPSAISDARQIYNSSLSVLRCHCAGVTVGTRSVTGLGDQATALFVTVGPDAHAISASGGPPTGVHLLVVSSNAEVALNYAVTVTATGTDLPPDAAQLPAVVSVARAILADLARPAVVSAAPVSAEPHYAGSRDPCRLITMATLAKYAPGATVTPDINPNASKNPNGSRTSTCSWNSNAVFILLNLNVFPDAASALQGFSSDAEASGQGGSGITVTGSRWLTGLGEIAAASYQTRSAPEKGVEILVWSGNIELDYWFAGTASVTPDRATLLAGGIAMARDGLAALASPSASSFAQGPVYASPHDACTLIKASTLARYTPGATVNTLPNPVSGPAAQLKTCSWDAPVGTLVLSVSTYTGADGALGGYEYDIQFAHQNQGGSTFLGAQPVKGLGDRATAIFETLASYPDVELYVLSGNAEIDLGISDLPFSPTLSRAQKLTADIAMARDVLADLRR